MPRQQNPDNYLNFTLWTRQTAILRQAIQSMTIRMMCLYQGDEIEPDTDTDPDMNDRFHVRLNAQKFTTGAD